MTQAFTPRKPSGTASGIAAEILYGIIPIGKTSARKPLEIKGFRAFYILMKMTLQHFCNTQCEFYKKEWLQVAIKFI
jgi:hypothetical protein